MSQWKKVSEGLEDGTLAVSGLVIKLKFPNNREQQREIVLKYFGPLSASSLMIPCVYLPVESVSVAIPLESMADAFYMLPDPFERWWQVAKQGMPDMTGVTAGSIELQRAEKLSRLAFEAGVMEGSKYARTEAGT